MGSGIISKDRPTVNVKRQHSLMSFIVTFDANGGVCSTISKTYAFPDDTYENLPTPTRTGYKFIGWYTEREHGRGNKVLTTTQALIKITKLYAHWVRLDLNMDGAVISDDDPMYEADMNSSTVYNTLPKPKKPNKFFIGWFSVREHGSGQSNMLKMTTQIDDSIDVMYGHWIELDVRDGAFPDQTTTYYSTDENYFSNLPIPTRSGFKFLGWYTAVESGTKVRTSTYTTLDDSYATLYAYWVGFDTKGGTIYESSITASSQTATTYNTMPTCNTRENMQFLGWFTEENGGTKVLTSTQIIDNTPKLYAHWLNLHVEGGSSVTPSRTDSATTTTYSTLPTPIKSGYKFLGWFTTETGGTKLLTSNTISSTITDAYARWLGFNSEGGSAITSTTASTNSSNTYGTLPTPTRSGFKFLGWYTAETGDTKILEAHSILSSTVMVYAHWMAFDVNGGSSVSSITAASNASLEIGTLPTASFARHKFLGWYTNATATIAKKRLESTLASTFSSVDTTVFARWVDFDSNGGVEITDTVAALNTDSLYFTMPIPTYDGYHFVGWFTEVEEGAEVTALSTIVLDNTVLHAHWLLKQKVTFHPGEGTSPKSEEYYAAGYAYGTYGLPVPSYPQHGFVGWYDNEEFAGDPITDDTIFDGVVTDLYAKWVDTITVTFNPNGGTCSTASSNHIPGDSYSVVGLPTPNTRAGYIFDGWHIGSDTGEKIGLDATVGVESITVYAKWLQISSSSNTWIMLLNAKCNALYKTNTITFSEQSNGYTLAKNTSQYSNSNEGFSVQMTRPTYSSGKTNYLVATTTCNGTITFKFKGNGTYSQYYRTYFDGYYLVNGSSTKYVTYYSTTGLTSWQSKTVALPTAGTNTFKMYNDVRYGYSNYHLGDYISEINWTPNP